MVPFSNYWILYGILEIYAVIKKENVEHYASDVRQVTYGVSGFLEKNRDTLSQNLFDAMKQSESAFVSELFTAVLRETGSFTASRYHASCLLVNSGIVIFDVHQTGD